MISYRAHSSHCIKSSVTEHALGICVFRRHQILKSQIASLITSNELRLVCPALSIGADCITLGLLNRFTAKSPVWIMTQYKSESQDIAQKTVQGLFTSPAQLQ